MESWLGQEKRVQTMPAARLAEATPELAFGATQRFELQAKRTQRERALKANQLAELRQLSENPPPLEEPERQNPRERLAMSPLPAWRSGRQELVSFAPGQPPSIPSPD
jgi:hypothetical protein